MSNAFVYARDDEKRRIRVTVLSPLSSEDCLAIVDRQASQGTWQYSLLYDMRLLRDPLPQPLADLLADRIQHYVETLGARGPVAVVARAPGVIGGAQCHAFTTAPVGVRIEVFWDLLDAEHWLDEQVVQS